MPFDPWLDEEVGVVMRAGVDIFANLSQVLVIVAHPDDETLMAGGTIKCLSDRGIRILGLSFTDGTSAREPSSDDLPEARAEAALQASAELGFEWLPRLNYPDQELDLISLVELAARIESILDTVRPELVITHSASDLNLDHRRVLEASLVALRPKPGYAPVVLSGEVVSATHWNRGISAAFDPNVFVDVSNQFDSKVRALRHYDEEMRPWPHARSYEALNALAGFRGSSVGVEKAEGFELLRMLVG